MIDDGFGNWLAGFIDGEGSFYIKEQRGNHWYCGFGLEVRNDDNDIVKEIYRRTGIGTLSLREPRNGNGAQISWKVQSVSDCLTFAGLLDTYPLRAKKARDYLVWREALDDQAAQRVRRGRKGPNRHASGFDPSYVARMRERREALKAIRIYGGQPREAGDVKAVEGITVPVAS